jgi:hypothetical protein
MYLLTHLLYRSRKHTCWTRRRCCGDIFHWVDVPGSRTGNLRLASRPPLHMGLDRAFDAGWKTWTDKRSQNCWCNSNGSLESPCSTLVNRSRACEGKERVCEKADTDTARLERDNSLGSEGTWMVSAAVFKCLGYWTCHPASAKRPNTNKYCSMIETMLNDRSLSLAVAFSSSFFKASFSFNDTKAILRLRRLPGTPCAPFNTIRKKIQ